MLYSAIENSGGFYHSPVARANRSNMNVPFTIPSSQDLEKEFIAAATKQGLVQTPVSALQFAHTRFRKTFHTQITQLAVLSLVPSWKVCQSNSKILWFLLGWLATQ